MTQIRLHARGAVDCEMQRYREIQCVDPLQIDDDTCWAGCTGAQSDVGAHLQWQAMSHHLNSCRGVGGRSLLARLIGVLAVTAMALGCSPSVPEAGVGKAGPAQSADKPGGGDSKQPTASVPSPPQPGECRNLRYDATSLFSDDTSPIPCQKGHTAYTFAVKKLPKDIAFTHKHAKYLVEVQIRAADRRRRDAHDGIRRLLNS